MTKVFIDHVWVGCISEALKVLNNLLVLKRKGTIHFSTSIFLNFKTNELIIKTGMGRLLRPLYFKEFDVVSYMREEHILENKFNKKEQIDLTEEIAILDKDSYKWSELQIIEYVDLHHQIYKDYVEISNLFSLNFVNVFQSFLNQNPLFFSKPSTINLHHSNWQQRFENMNLLQAMQHPLCSTNIRDYVFIPGTGMNVSIALMHTGQQLIVNRASIERGLFRNHQYTFVEEIETERVGFADITNIANISSIREDINFSYLDKDGIIKQHTGPTNERTALIGKIVRTQNNDIEEDAILCDMFYPCYVDETMVLLNDNKKHVKIRLRKDYNFQQGNIIRFRNGFQLAVSNICDLENMPYSSKGRIPDMIIDPVMIAPYVGLLKELFFTNILSLFGGILKSDPFHVFEPLPSFLSECGLHSEGFDIFYAGETGQQIEAEIFSGFSFVELINNSNDYINNSNDYIMLPIGKDGKISKKLTETFINIPKEFLEEIHLMNALNIHPLFITDKPKNLEYTKIVTPSIPDMKLTKKPKTKSKEVKEKDKEKEVKEHEENDSTLLDIYLPEPVESYFKTITSPPITSSPQTESQTTINPTSTITTAIKPETTLTTAPNILDVVEEEKKDEEKDESEKKIIIQ
jgi:DNA-directed RNA polymerase beta subunit